MRHGRDKTMLKQVVCLCLVLSQMGCRSVYRFHCTSYPSEAGVLVADEMMGETPCDVEIPRDSEMIEDGKIAFRFCLPDGGEKTKIVDLYDFEPSNPLAEFVAAPFFLVGGGTFLLAINDDDKEEDSSWNHGDDEDAGDRLVAGLAGLGVAGIGAGLYCLLGGKFEAMKVHEVHISFNECVDGVESPVPASQGVSRGYPTRD